MTPFGDPRFDHLLAYERRLARLLAIRQGRFVHPEAICGALEVTRNNLHVTVWNLRCKLGQNVVRTAYGGGGYALDMESLR